MFSLMTYVVLDANFLPLLRDGSSSEFRSSSSSNKATLSKPPLLCNRKEQLFANNEKGKDFSLLFFLAESTDVNFSKSEIDDGKVEWDLSVVGYAMGKRSFYESLLTAPKRKWNFKGYSRPPHS